MSSSPSGNPPVNQNDENNPWGWRLWYDKMVWKNKLEKSATHKALGIPEDDDMQITNQSSKSGITWKEIAAMGLIGLGGAGMYSQWDRITGKQTTEVSSQESSSSSTVTKDMEIRFYDQNGNPVNVPHVSTRPQD